MVVKQIDIAHVRAVKSERHPPIAAHIHCPMPSQVAFKRVQAQAGDIHVLRPGRRVQPPQNRPNLARMPRCNPTRLVPLVQSSQALMPEVNDHPSGRPLDSFDVELVEHFLGLGGVVVGLELDPESRSAAERFGEAHGHFCRDLGVALTDVFQRLR